MVRVFLALWLALTPSFASAGSLTLLGAGKSGGGVAGYQGPGDVAGTAFAIWGSCARAYNASYASSGTSSMCDLVDASTGTVAICTLRAATTGFVDLAGTYCTGSTTPSAACAAAAGGACKVTKVYNQVNPGTNDVVQATAANMPGIVFNNLSGLPTVTCTGTTIFMQTSASVSAAGSYLMSIVYERTANFTTGMGFAGSSTGVSIYLGSAASANTAVMNAGGTSNNGAATDSAWHGLNAIYNGASSVLNIDGTDGSASTAGSNTWASAQPFRVCRGGAAQASGSLAEFGWMNSSAGSASRTAIFSNMNGINGYNGAL